MKQYEVTCVWQFWCVQWDECSVTVDDAKAPGAWDFI